MLFNITYIKIALILYDTIKKDNIMTIAFTFILIGLAAVVFPLRRNRFYLLNAALVIGLSYIAEHYWFRISAANLLSVKTIMLFVVFHVICINFTTFIAYGVDKRAAVNHQWRIPENDLHMLEFLGGWIGAFIAQRFFHHKTSKKSFQNIYFLMIVMEIAVLWFLYNYLGLSRFF